MEARARRIAVVLLAACVPAVALALLANCRGGSADESPSPSPTGSPTVTASSSAPDLTVFTRPTYYQDVLPILQGRCTQCHFTGGVGSVDFTNDAVAVAFAPAIAEQTRLGLMPPWLPGTKTPSLLHLPTLTPEEIATLAAWAKVRGHLGDPKNPSPPLAREKIDLGKPELVLDLGVDYLPDGAVSDDYRCFLIDPGLVEDRFAIGFRVTPGNAATVHHAAVHFFDVASHDALVALDAASSDRAGWPCPSGAVPEGLSGVNRVTSLGTWDPSVDAVVMPKGTGSQIPAGVLVVAQMHYRVQSVDPDRSKVEIALAPKGSTLQRLTIVRMVDRSMSIAPTSKGTTVEPTSTFGALTKPGFFPDGTGYVTMVAMQMHLLGAQGTLEIETSAGKRTLLDIPRWDMHWQGTYQLATPIAVGPSDTLRARCVYDNTPEHLVEVKWPSTLKTVAGGEALTDETCVAELMIIDELPK